jgi:hypothetical protein
VIRIGEHATRGPATLELVQIDPGVSGFVLRWVLRMDGRSGFGLMDAAGPRGPELRCSVTDDAGRTYVSRPMNGHGDDHQWTQDDRFTPGLPVDASRLLIRVDVIELARADANGPLEPRTWPGPWEFSVDLSSRPA